MAVRAIGIMYYLSTDAHNSNYNMGIASLNPFRKHWYSLFMTFPLSSLLSLLIGARDKSSKKQPQPLKYSKKSTLDIFSASTNTFEKAFFVYSHNESPL